jgi:branched-chain amino acid transport system substrate-binding protein
MKKSLALTTLSVLVVAGTLTACSSSNGGSDNGTTSAKPSATPTFTGPDIKVGVIADLTTVSVMGNPSPEVVSAANAALDAINLAGGVNGSKIVLVPCDDKGDPNTATNCSRQFVSDGVVATVGDNTPYGDKLNPVLQSAGIPRVGPLALSSAEYTAKNNYPLNGGAVVMFQGAAVNAGDNGHKNAFLVYTAGEGSSTLTGLVQSTYAAHGLTDKGSVGIPTGAADLSPYVAKAMKSGADVVITSFGAATTQQFLQTSIQLGAKYTIATIAEALDTQVIAAVGKDQPMVQGALLTSPYPPVHDTAIPGVKQYQDELAARAATGDKHAENNNVLNTWLAVHMFADVAKTISGPVTAASVVKALDSAKDLDTYGLMPPWTPSQSGGMLARVSNGTAWFLKIDKDGNLVRDKDTYQQILPAAAS